MLVRQRTWFTDATDQNLTDSGRFSIISEGPSGGGGVIPCHAVSAGAYSTCPQAQEPSTVVTAGRAEHDHDRYVLSVMPAHPSEYAFGRQQRGELLRGFMGRPSAAASGSGRLSAATCSPQEVQPGWVKVRTRFQLSRDTSCGTALPVVDNA